MTDPPDMIMSASLNSQSVDLNPTANDSEFRTSPVNSAGHLPPGTNHSVCNLAIPDEIIHNEDATDSCHESSVAKSDPLLATESAQAPNDLSNAAY
jgi:hypothetical protein